MAHRFCFGLSQVVGFVIAGLTNMPNPANAELLVTPEAVTLAGNRNSTVSTTLTLSGETDAISLETAASDLRSVDGAAIISATDIAIEPHGAVDVPANAPVQVTITIDLAQASANGEFTGLLYLFHNGGRQVIPLTIRVKAASIWPWILMFAGVGLGTWLSFYRDDGRIRDEILLAASRFQNRVEADPDLRNDSEASQAFRASIENTLKRVVLAIEDKDLGGGNNFETAQIRLQEASELWDRWVIFRGDWIAQFRYGRQLSTKLQEVQGETDIQTIFMQGVQDNLSSIYRKLRTGQFETPQALSEEFVTIRQQLSFHRVAEELVDDLKRQSQQLGSEEASAWSKTIDNLMTQLDNSEPNQDEQDKWQERFNSMQEALNAEVAAHQGEKVSEVQGRSATLRGRSGGESGLSVDTIPLVPRTSGTVTPRRASQARRNLFWFKQTSRGVAVIGLAWLGMIELYAGKPTFGSEPLSDYFALLAWGFGAEVTRESVVRATQSLGVTLTSNKSGGE